MNLTNAYHEAMFRTGFTLADMRIDTSLLRLFAYRLHGRIRDSEFVCKKYLVCIGVNLFGVYVVGQIGKKI